MIPTPANVSGFDTTYISTADSDPKHAQNSVVGGCLVNSSGARYSNFQTSTSFWDSLSPILGSNPTQHRGILVAHAARWLIGAWNPML